VTREVEIHGERVKLYEVRGYSDGWCSDPELTQRIERRRRDLLRILRAAAKDMAANVDIDH
jgi:hypothetical protein